VFYFERNIFNLNSCLLNGYVFKRDYCAIKKKMLLFSVN